MVTFLASLGGLKKEVAGSQRSGLTAWSCGSSWPSLELPIWWFENPGEYLFPGRKCPYVCKGIHWLWINGSLTHCGKDVVMASPLVFLIFLDKAPPSNCMNSSRVSIHGHCFCVNGHQIEQHRQTETWDQYPERGHTLTPPSGQNGPEDPEAFGSAPSQSPPQSLVRKPNHHETWYCLEIQVISTKDERAAQPRSHAWEVPIVEDMVWDGKLA